MYPGTYAAQAPDRIAAVMAGTGETVSYGELERRSVQLARVLREAGLRPGDVVALLTENSLRALEVYWAALRSGLYITAVNHRLKPAEVAYIVNDSGAAALIVSAEQAANAIAVMGLTEAVKLRLAFGGAVAGYDGYEATIAAASATPFDEQPHGATMLYSSGTTGRPKGVRPPLPDIEVDAPGEALVELARLAFGFREDTVYLSPGPIYHAAPLRFCGAVQALGGTVVMMRRFEAEPALRALEDHRATHAQFVPTMFVRMLQLPPEVRGRYDITSLRVAIHAAAPCPVEVKQKMIDWWGPILLEYYAGTEGNGMTAIDSGTWLTKPGTVGRPILGTVRICADDGTELPAGQTGGVYFERDEVPFTYHNDPDKTRASQHPDHPTWTTLGDIGHLDEDGFLFLTDRKAFMIISGGVNIYPQEIENVLALHPAVHDVAVIGVPDPEMGESVAAFVQPATGAVPGPELEQEIIAFVKSKIASFKAPRTVRFVDELPRSEAGKLMKSELRARYAGGNLGPLPSPPLRVPGCTIPAMNPLSGVLDEAWRMYKTFAKHFLAIAFVIYLIAAVITAVLALAAGTVGLLLASLVSIVAAFVLQATLVKAVQDVRDGRADLSIGQTVNAAVPYIAPVAGASILAGIAITIGLLLIIVPGLFLITIWAVIVPVIIIERSGALASFGRSRQLVRGHGWHVFGTLVLVYIIMLVVNIVLGVIFSALPHVLGDGLSSIISGTLISPFLAIVVTLVYYRLVASSTQAGGGPYGGHQQPEQYGGYAQPPQGGGDPYGGYQPPPQGGWSPPPPGGYQPPPQGGGWNQPPQGGSEPPTQQVPRWEGPEEPR